MSKNKENPEHCSGLNEPDDILFIDDIDDEVLFRDMDDVVLIGDDSSEQSGNRHQVWKVLIVDDDPDVLMVTQLALAGLEVLGLPVQLIQADSFRDAQSKLNDSDYAVIITDAIMETEDAGLLLIDWVSKQKRFYSTRLVLRTGQPGRFHESVILRNYKIHDYWPKTELTAGRMRTILMGLIRSYQDLQSLSSETA